MKKPNHRPGPTMLSVRRMPQMVSDIRACQRYHRLFTGAPELTESDIVRSAIMVYRDVLKKNCVKAGKVKE